MRRITLVALIVATTILAPSIARADTPLGPGQTKTPGHACYSTIQPPDGQGCPQRSDEDCIGTPRLVGECTAARRGWFDGPNTGNQWSCLDTLWGSDESGWDPHAVNPESGAGGIPQAKPPSKMGADWWDNVVEQVTWGDAYVGGRFGSPCAALSFRLAHGWY